MTRLTHRTWLTALLLIAALLAPVWAQARKEKEDKSITALASLKPTSVEVGTVESPESGEPEDLAGVVRFGSWADFMGFWPDHVKSIAQLPEDFTLPADQPYRSKYPDAFVVAGQPIAGVGLLARTPSMYHWIEYAIPENTRGFTARAFFTDDPFGHVRGYRNTTNHNGTFSISIDGTRVLKKDFLRQKIEDGSGEKFLDIEVPIPDDAKVIRFRIEHSPWGDGNNNTELVLYQARFHHKK